MRKSTFLTKTAAQAQINTPTLMKENVNTELLDENMHPIEREKAIITRLTTELSGAHPYMFGTTAYLMENFKDKVNREAPNFFIRIGSKTDPVPFSLVIDTCIGDHKDQKKLFMQEFYRLLTPKPVWLPTGDGRMALVPPFRITPISKDLKELEIKDIQKYQNIGIDAILNSVIIECYEPLFAGHFNGHKDGFIKQPKAFYATIRDMVMRMKGTENANFDYMENDTEDDNGKTTAVNIYKTWIYLSLKDGGTGTEKSVNLIDLLKAVSPRLLLQKDKTFYIRNERLGILTNIIKVLYDATNKRKADLDFTIDGFANFDKFDWEYAAKQGYPKGSDNVYSILYALKHHLKTHNNWFDLGIARRKISSKTRPKKSSK